MITMNDISLNLRLDSKPYFVIWLVLQVKSFSGPAVLCDGVRQRRRLDVPDPAVWEVQGAGGCVSASSARLLKKSLSPPL